MFVVIVTAAIPEHLYGYIGRFLSEIDAGVFVGKVSPVVRDNLVGRCHQAVDDGKIVVISSSAETEQGFVVETLGRTSRKIIDMDGLLLSAMVSRGCAIEEAQPREAETLDQVFVENEGLIR
ncbi:type I-E CRISPR-associated endoribonuclease Cas2e [Trueperella pyogenes]|uniref:type I-E CRISPR-associated endoribonuclease Cas2e n=1 Tax=Trueperella pyogenes TaxID=1661 RepID=UPI002166D272|nr:type I-E CRISPR-associated endoribonuclease Cas2e [Trueperella pyogenes]UVJ57739.1 type I-E CRISPR-associated endoribonuclease Cas2e [Trueperella pyogenes]